MGKGEGAKKVTKKKKRRVRKTRNVRKQNNNGRRGCRHVCLGSQRFNPLDARLGGDQVTTEGSEVKW